MRIEPELKARIEKSLDNEQHVVVLLRRTLDEVKGKGTALDNAQAIPYQGKMAKLVAPGHAILGLASDADVEEIIEDAEYESL